LCTIRTNQQSAHQDLISRPIRESGLKLEGSPVERLVGGNLSRARCQGTDQIAAPMLLTTNGDVRGRNRCLGLRFMAHAALAELEKKRTTGKTREKSWMYLRQKPAMLHLSVPAAHSGEWTQRLVRSAGPIADNYATAPFSRDYAAICRDGMPQKHPAKTVAETFSLADDPPFQTGRKRYRGWQRLRSALSRPPGTQGGTKRDPPRRRGQNDITVDEMETTSASSTIRPRGRKLRVTKLAPDN